ncbi:membrane associated rhomboid family serine protease [Saccharopolyspora erythraea NRRL 2338]|uniref:Rhomboid family intramembrane serine protease n=1 Tax=Saccharopolyspora erythraea TaxID=1836 RepID=A0ABN1D916_SACER|nr:rhomboid family intramembrane serine protease [Saccharopolyspora erythraea]EQD87929.1 protease [Saccharopolyspora erythraea D]PFG93188.1 membrane associated rhomboid family serine protease [Saccharopolyspora erythraea NRRL 2338]QRK90049.1 rhomboid family intramembrane serine protease [Saccharopolyspora erythraea]
MTVPPHGQPTGSDGAPPLQACVRHPDRPTGLRCTRCERPACPDCLREASVGYHCVDCVQAGRGGTRQAVTVAGARLAAKPVVVPVLIAVNVLVHVYTSVQAGSGMDNFDSDGFATSALLPILVAGGQWWRLVTSGFLHIGLPHLAMNMIALWVIGRDLELVLGRLRFTAVYFLSLLGGSTAVFVFGELVQPVAGASGAVYGLMGGIAVAALRLKVSLRPVLIVIGLNVLLSVTIPGLSLLGHLGGLFVGAAATAALVYAPRQRRLLFQGGALAAIFLVLAVALVTKDMSLGNMVCTGYGGAGTRCAVG